LKKILSDALFGYEYYAEGPLAPVLPWKFVQRAVAEVRAGMIFI
jgi:hypothetical protein